MDILNLLAEARAAGLTIRLHGDQAEVEGPKSAAPIVRRMMESKAELVEALRREYKRFDLWSRLEPGECRILDVQTGREWSEYPDGSVREWTPAFNHAAPAQRQRT